jgi:D-3-phosphoglycerate dehydrogenase
MAAGMKKRVLVSAPYMQAVLDEYRSRFAGKDIELIVPTTEERLDEQSLLDVICEVDGVICGDDEFTERVLRAAPRLKVISKWGTGTDSIDRDAARQLGISVRNSPGAFTEPVADSVLGYILCFARELPWMDRDVRAGLWTKRVSRTLRECTLGVVGVGRIGKAVIERAVAFKMQVLGNDIVEIPAAFVADTGLRVVSLEELLPSADFVSLNCDLNPTSFHLIGVHELGSMKRTAYLINTARGPVVNEVELVRALKDRRIAGAALDVFEIEPLPVDSPLRWLDNLMLAPHNANASPRYWRLVHEATVQNLLSGLEE